VLARSSFRAAVDVLRPSMHGGFLGTRLHTFSLARAEAQLHPTPSSDSNGLLSSDQLPVAVMLASPPSALPAYRDICLDSHPLR
jgi:hypothetical protein